MRWLIVVGSALVLAVTGGGPSGSSVSMARESSTYTLLQMNLCLSGFAHCYGKVAYPAGVEEAVARIRAAHPDAVTLNETCRGDVARIARRTGYHLRFSTVTVSGEPLACVRPGGRGRFGDAVLTKAAVEQQRQPRLRGAGGDRVAPVAVRHDASRRRRVHSPPRDALDRERRAVRRARRAPRSAGGHADGHLRWRPQPQPRLRAGARLEPDRRLRRTGPGLQSISGTGALRSPSAEVLPATHTDHDFLVVRSRLGPSQR